MVSGSPAKKILLVGDDVTVRHSLDISLQALGYALVTACDAATAVSQARRSDPDVIVLDIDHPAGDGFVITETLQGTVQTAAIPIVCITAFRRAGSREGATALGAVHYLEKPFVAADLADAVEQACAQALATFGGGGTAEAG